MFAGGLVWTCGVVIAGIWQQGSCSPGCCADASGCRTSRCSRRDPRAATTSPRTLSGGCSPFSCRRRGSHAGVVIGVTGLDHIFDDSPLNPLSRPEYLPVPPGSAGSSAPPPSSSGSTRPLSAPALCTSSSPNNRSCGRRSLRTSFGWLQLVIQPVHLSRCRHRTDTPYKRNQKASQSRPANKKAVCKSQKTLLIAQEGRWRETSGLIQCFLVLPFGAR